MDKKTGSLIIIKFFDQYRQLCNDILKTKLGFYVVHLYMLNDTIDIIFCRERYRERD